MQGRAGEGRGVSRSTCAFPAGASEPQITVNGAAVAGGAGRQGLREDRPHLVQGRRGRAAIPDGSRGSSAALKPSSRPPTASTSASSRTALFQPRRLPYASVLYGPLLVCACRFRDVDPNTPAKGAKWQYALDADAERGRRRHPGRAQADAGPLGLAAWTPRWCLTAPARAFDWKPTDAQALPNGPVAGTSSETIRLVPYGCTKFRISMFPVTPRMVNN